MPEIRHWWLFGYGVMFLVYTLVIAYSLWGDVRLRVGCAWYALGVSLLLFCVPFSGLCFWLAFR